MKIYGTKTKKAAVEQKKQSKHAHNTHTHTHTHTAQYTRKAPKIAQTRKARPATELKHVRGLAKPLGMPLVYQNAAQNSTNAKARELVGCLRPRKHVG